MIRIAIDCRSLRKQPAGVPNFLISTINHLAQEKKDWKIYLLANEDFHTEVNQRLNRNSNVQRIIDPLPIFKNLATLWFILKLPSILRKLNPDYYYSPIPNLPFFVPSDIKTIITVHDMVYKLFPKTMARGNWIINFFLHDQTIKKADKIWAISNYTKREIDRFFTKRKAKQVMIGTAIEKTIFFRKEYSQNEIELMRKRYLINSKFILTVGTLEPRKNLEFLFKLMPKLSNFGFKLVIVGGKGWGQLEFPHKSQDYIITAQYVPLNDLITLYHMAALYISTSINEGFCLPLLEAMSCGCPVVAAHNSGMIEVVEGGGETVSNWEEDTWIEAILKVYKNRGQYIKMGLLKSKNYSWQRVTKNFTEYITS